MLFLQKRLLPVCHKKIGRQRAQHQTERLEQAGHLKGNQIGIHQNCHERKGGKNQRLQEIMIFPVHFLI